MHRFRRHPRLLVPCFLFSVLLVLAVRPVHAHKLKVYASAVGKTISGYVYFPGGGRARKVKVEVLGPGGKKLGQTMTNQNGAFTFEAALKCDHEFVVDVGDGHRAAYTVAADELSGTLVPVESESAGGGAPPMASSPAGQESIDAKALAIQVRKLREQIEAYEEKTRLRDILGGIGYILGLAGIAFYFLGCRRKNGEREQSP